jgi:hypothetical protein
MAESKSNDFRLFEKTRECDINPFNGLSDIFGIAGRTSLRDSASKGLPFAQKTSPIRARGPRPSPVCTENSMRIDLVTESPNFGDDGRAVMLLSDAVRLAVEVQEPT